MPIASANLKLYESAHSAAVQDKPSKDSLGGAITDTEVSNAINAFWDEVTGDESADGDTNYRAAFVQNKHATLTGPRCKVYFSSNYRSNISMKLIEAVNTAAQQLTDEETAPVGGTDFTAPANRAAALQMGDLAPNAYRAVYFRRVIQAGDPAKNVAQTDLQKEIDTPE